MINIDKPGRPKGKLATTNSKGIAWNFGQQCVILVTCETLHCTAFNQVLVLRILVSERSIDGSNFQLDSNTPWLLFDHPQTGTPAHGQGETSLNPDRLLPGTLATG